MFAGEFQKLLNMSMPVYNKIITVILPGVMIVTLILVVLWPVTGNRDYTIIQTTIFELGAQSSPWAFLINTGLTILGCGTVWSGWRFYEGFTFARILLVIFGSSVVLTGICNQAPVLTQEIIVSGENGWHTYFRSTAALSFVLLTMLTAYILDREFQRRLALITGVSFIILTLISSKTSHWEGLAQRVVFIIAFGWLIYNFIYGKIR
jgi:hypothetical protein